MKGLAGGLAERDEADHAGVLTWEVLFAGGEPRVVTEVDVAKLEPWLFRVVRGARETLSSSSQHDLLGHDAGTNILTTGGPTIPAPAFRLEPLTCFTDPVTGFRFVLKQAALDTTFARATWGLVPEVAAFLRTATPGAAVPKSLLAQNEEQQQNPKSEDEQVLLSHANMNSLFARNLSVVEIDNSISVCSKKNKKLSVLEFNQGTSPGLGAAMQFLYFLATQESQSAATDEDDFSGSPFDLIFFNELDVNMPRSGNIHTARVLAHLLGMNFAWGVEFWELDTPGEVHADHFYVLKMSCRTTVAGSANSFT